MLVEIAIALFIWFAVILSTPAKLRVFFALVSGSVIFLLLTFSLLSPSKELMVYIPGENGQKGFEVPFQELQSLLHPSSDSSSLIAMPDIEALKSLNKQVLIFSDLNAEQLKALEGHPDYQAFMKEQKGLVIRNVKARIENNKVVPESDAVEFSNLPLLEDLHRKQKVLDAIREIVQVPASKDRS